jgi:ornithine cyclodeaminase/alanine dehydrogenase
MNMAKFGLPNIMGTIVLFDAEKGTLLAIVDSIEPTIKRTGAGTAVAAKYLARPDSRILTICGCGDQGRIQLTALKEVLAVERVFAFDQNHTSAKDYAAQMSGELGIPVEATESLQSATSLSDVLITCTPSKKPFVMKKFIKPGTFVAAIGSDSPDKQELETSLLQGTKVVVDIFKQCAVAGELHHGLESGMITKDVVHAEIGQIVAGKKPGRETPTEIIVYDATGTALQDTAAVALCYEKAMEKGIGQFVDFLK